MRIVISALHFDWPTIDAAFEHAARGLGLDGVELSLHPSFQRPHCTRDDLPAIRPAAERWGLSITGHIWDDLPALGPSVGAEALLGWLAVCRQTGIRGLVLHGGSFPDRREGLERLRAALAPVLPAFEQSGVVLHMENHYAYDYHAGHELLSEPWEFLEVFGALQSPSLRFCFDTGHGNMTRNTEPLLRELAPHLAYVHLADNHGVDDDHVGFGQGTVEWGRVFGLLAEVGFDGTFCVEFPVRDDRGPFEACVAELRNRFARRAGG